MNCILSFTSILFSFGLFSQSYDYYHIGDTSDIETQTTFGVCMMGGASEDDNGSAWFLNRANEGNVVVIRASGSDGYNSYFYNDLGVSLQSVETIVFNDASAAEDPFVIRRLEGAEAIWIAGGDQFLYEQYWKNTSIMQILNDHVNVKTAPIGGTSAGMAILGEYYFNASVSSVTSNEALNNPYDNGITIATDFLNIPFLENTITDTHYDNPDRKGRQSVFIARIMETMQDRTFGIAANEYVAICVDENGIATVFGNFPDYNDKAFFIQTNCRNQNPELMDDNIPLTWVGDENDALIVFEIEARDDGSSTFNLVNWELGQNGEWKHWTINQGELDESIGQAPDCILSVVNEKVKFTVFPNPASDNITIEATEEISMIALFDSSGKQVKTIKAQHHLDVSDLKNGIYFIEIHLNANVFHTKISVQQ